MIQRNTAGSPEPGRGFRIKSFLFWACFVAFVGGGLYSGALSLPRILGWVNTVVPTGLGQRPFPFDLFASNPENAPDWNNRERVNILVLGVDRRPDEGRDAPSRTDTIMILTIDPFSQSAGILSIPRDTWIPIPVRPGGVLHDRINTANVYGQLYDYPGGGPALAKETIQYNLGVRVHYYLMVDFEGFERMINAVGGITLDIPAPLVDYEYPTPNYGTMRIFIPAGVQHLNGERTLWYVRSRHQDSDFGRIQRQQQALLAIRQRLLQLDAIPRLPLFWAEFKDAVRTDLSLGAIINLAKAAREVKEENIIGRSLEAPYTSSTTTLDGAYILLPNRNKIRELIEEVFSDARKQEEAARIEVLNGTNTAGLAAQTARQLQAYGFENISIRDADGGPRRVTEILNLSGKTYTANLVAALLRVPRDRIKSVARSDGDPADIRVILGDDLAKPVG